MPEVSVLIPAFRPQYLDLAIASILAQTYTDFELIVSDDSNGDDVERVVSKWSDARLRYVRNNRRQLPGANRDYLISLARGRYLKFVFDDDFLLPRSLEVLYTAAMSVDGDLVFHGRYLVDDQGRPLGKASVLEDGQVAKVDPPVLFVSMLGGIQNFIGEPSNILISADMLRAIPNPFGIGGERLRFLTDVALYVNIAASGGTIVGAGAIGSAFRFHASQTSAVGGSAYSAGLFEWEYIVRWAADRGFLDSGSAISAISTCRSNYLPFLEAYPELRVLATVSTPTRPDESFLAAQYMTALRSAWDTVDQRNSRSRAVA